MSERIETVSFDVDVAGATRQIDAYINTLNKLDKELADLQKAGKDTAATQQKIAATTAALNKALQGETKTLAGAVAQTAAYDKAQKSLNATTQKTVVATTNLDTVTKKQTASFGRSLAGAKNLTQAFSRGLGGLSNLVGGFGLASIGVNLLSDGVAKLVDEFFKASQAQTSLANVNKAYAETVATETAALQVNFAALNNTTLSLTQRKEALGALIEQFPEYFGGLDAEKATVQELQLAYEATTIAIKQKAIQTALAAERQKLASNLIKTQIETELELAKVEKARAEAVATGSTNAIKANESVAKSLRNILAINTQEIKEAEEALTAVEKALGGQITETDKEKVKAAEEAAKRRVKDEKAADAAAEKAKQRREAAAADRQKEREAIAAENAENERLKGTLAGLQKELAKIDELLKSSTKITDKERLEELGAEYQRITKDIEKATEAINAVTQARKADEVQVIENAKIGNIETELLRGRIAANQKALEQQELQRQRQLNQIETNRQAALSATQNDTARTIIESANAKKREDFERESAENILQLRIKLQKQKLDLAQREGQETTQIADEILKLEAELLALTGKRYDIKIGVDDKSAKTAKEKLKELVNQVADVVQEFSGQVFDFLNSQNAQTIANADAAISKQQEVLNALLSNEETANVEQVRLEQERLAKLNEQREKAKEEEARIAQAQIAINLALAVARAVAEGGGVASAITVGLALSAAIFGFIKAKQTAEQSFYEGTMYAERAPHEPRGRDTIKANVNEGEAIIPTDTTRKYNAALEAIYYGKIPASDMNAMVGDYLNGVSHGRDEMNAAAESSKREFRILHTAREERRPAAVLESSNTADLRAVVELVVTELRKQPQQIIKGDKIVSLVQSKADARGRMRKRYCAK
jgi:hypothetical protein